MVSSHPELPAGNGWLFAEVTGASAEEAEAAAQAVARDAGVPHRIVTDTVEQLALWRIREDGAGLAARSLSRPAQAGWEDAAVPPAKLGAYLRDFDALLKEHALDGVPYGHFGDGCVHVRIDFELEDARGRQTYRDFVENAADLVASYGGSMSGEHGDGRARSELLPRMYSPEAIALMEQAKRILDPANLLNPGVLVDPAPVRLGPAAGGADAADPDDAEAHPRRRLLQGRRAPLHRRRQVRRRQHRVERGDVPVLPGHPGREGLHPRPRARAPGRRQRHARVRRRRRSARRSTSACPARAARRTARPASTWRRTSPRPCRRSTPARCARAPTTPSASCPGGPG